VKKMIATLVGVGVFAAASILAVVATAGTASADTCRESLWGEDIWGNKRFDCSDGTYTLKKPFGTNRWDDPWADYRFEKDGYFRGNGWSGTCTYDSFWDEYECRS